MRRQQQDRSCTARHPHWRRHRRTSRLHTAIARSDTWHTRPEVTTHTDIQEVKHQTCDTFWYGLDAVASLVHTDITPITEQHFVLVGAVGLHHTIEKCAEHDQALNERQEQTLVHVTN
jgi:hypothetical protein